MHLTIPHADLKRLADAAGKEVVEHRYTIPILSTLRLVADDGRLTITGTDLDIEASASAGAEVAAPGGTAVDAHRLIAIVAALSPAGPVTLRLDGDRCRIEAGRSRFVLNTLSPDDFPDARPTAPKVRFRLPAARFGALVEPTRFAISTEETRYYLNGIYLHAHEGRLRAVATDGHRLSLAEIALPEGAADMPGIIVPRKTVQILGKRAGEAADWRFAVSDAAITVESDGWRLHSKLIDGQFPEYARVIPDPAAARLVVTVDRALLAAVVDRIGAVMTDRSRARLLEFSGRSLRLSTRNPDAGNAEETIDVATEGEMAGAVGFNGKYLAEVLDALATPEIRLHLVDPGSPALISPVAPALDAPGQTLVLMPMRV